MYHNASSSASKGTAIDDKTRNSGTNEAPDQAIQLLQGVDPAGATNQETTAGAAAGRRKTQAGDQESEPPYFRPTAHWPLTLAQTPFLPYHWAFHAPIAEFI